MKKIILALAIILTTGGVYSFERKDDCFTYKAIGLDLVVPSIAFGVRKWDGSTGVDLNFSVSSVLFVSRIAVNVAHLKKFNESGYVGVGAGTFVTHVALDKRDLIIGGVFPSLTIGKEYKNTFHEVRIAVPQMSTLGMSYYPLVSYRYGF